MYTVTALLEAGASTQSTELLHYVIRGKDTAQKKPKKAFAYTKSAKTSPDRTPKNRSRTRSKSPKKVASKKIAPMGSPKRKFLESEEEKVDTTQEDEVTIFDLLQKHNYSFSHVDSEGINAYIPCNYY
jgi:hypothetical protein